MEQSLCASVHPEQRTIQMEYEAHTKTLSMLDLEVKADFMGIYYWKRLHKMMTPLNPSSQSTPNDH